MPSDQTKVPSVAVSEKPIHQLVPQMDQAVLLTEVLMLGLFIDTRCPPNATQAASAVLQLLSAVQ
jgi:hypothetical protein